MENSKAHSIKDSECHSEGGRQGCILILSLISGSTFLKVSGCYKVNVISLSGLNISLFHPKDLYLIFSGSENMIVAYQKPGKENQMTINAKTFLNPIGI